MEKKDKDILRRNGVELVQTLDVGDSLLAFLVGKHILTDEMEERIKEHSVKQQRARASALLMLLPKRGAKAFGVFIEALVETKQEDLANLLDPVLTARLLKDKPETVHSQETKASGEVQPADKQWVEKLLKQDDVYDMTTYPRGRAVIINNEFFTKVSPPRLGTQVDEQRLEQLFKSLYFEVDVHKDLTADEIRTTLDQESQNQKPGANAFILCILSHGKEGVIVGTDEEHIAIDTITAMFDGKSCPQLLNKPKIFVFQACQGKTKTKGVPVKGTDSDMADSMNELSVVDSPDPKPFPTDVTVHEKNDTIVAYSTVTGYIAIRHKEEGSWFINDLVDTFSEHACHLDISQMLIKVNDKVSQRRAVDGRIQAIQTVQSLRKNLYFFPGYAVKR